MVGKYPSKIITYIKACNGSPSDSTMRTCNIQPGSFASGTKKNLYPVQIMASNLHHGTGNPDLGHVEALSSVQLVFRLLEHSYCALALAVYLRDMPHLKSTRPSVYLQSHDREIISFTKMDGSWSDISCVGTWFRW